MFYVQYFISKTHEIYEIMWKNMVEPERPHKHRHTLRICNTYCFSTTTMVMRRSHNVLLYV